MWRLRDLLNLKSFSAAIWTLLIEELLIFGARQPSLDNRPWSPQLLLISMVSSNFAGSMETRSQRVGFPDVGPFLCKLSRYYISFFDISLQRTEKIREWHIRYGPIICIGPKEVSVATPTLMREIYGSAGGYAKSKYFDHFVAYGERALFAIRPYEDHRERRKVIASFYHDVSKASVENHINERVDRVIGQIDRRQGDPPIDVFSLTSHFAFDIISRLLYGKRHCSRTIGVDGEERQILHDLKKAQLWGPVKFDMPSLYGFIRFLLSLLNCLPSPLHADEDLMRWNYNKINDVLAHSGGATTDVREDSLLHRLLNATNPDGKKLSLNYITSELYDNLNAAEITVAVSLTYIIYHLSENPKWQTRIREEILGLPCEVNGFPSFTSINSAPIMEAFIREVYRVNPGTGGHAERVVPSGGKIYDGIYIPEGIRITASTIALHHDATIFTSPDVFDPTRWLGRTPSQARTLDRSLIPFGYGARICAGKLLATMEIKLLIARLYVRYETRVDPCSKTTRQSMAQYATHDSVPRGLRCDITFHLIEDGNGEGQQTSERVRVREE
ncbi:hypothetical protein JMJ35_006851 [Cladonia borealis]|uniref:Cytochrome P450 n=1 Tax=Cladonia borealis TaxID=184061 RepID=A0AA39V3V6_9LECA|nr:hypothetical protein JMJ35_006851 [Cladonia borealis]